jgi:gamma-glutamyltranspeptidase / glutathione hydrolase
MTAIGPWELRKPAVVSAGGIVAGQSRRAAAAGAAILAAGGNAVDAAIATGFALGAAEPWMSGIGGCGFMVVQPPDGPAAVVDFGLLAAGALDPARYGLLPGAGGDQDIFGWPRVAHDRNVIGPDSAALPTYVEGVRLAHERFGRLAWPALLEPAVALAEEGILLDWYGALAIAVAAPDLALFEATRRLFLPGGPPPLPGNGTRPRYLPLPALARTLRRLASAGARDFYEGEIARRLAGELEAAGSPLSAGDLAGYRARAVPALEFGASASPPCRGSRAARPCSRCWPGWRKDPPWARRRAHATIRPMRGSCAGPMRSVWPRPGRAAAPARGPPPPAISPPSTVTA